MMQQAISMQASAVLTAGLLTTTAILAQEMTGPSPTNLPPIVVQASRTGKTVMRMPSTVQIITGEEIAQS